MKKHQKSILLNISILLYFKWSIIFLSSTHVYSHLLEYWKYYSNHSLPTDEYSEIPMCKITLLVGEENLDLFFF